MFDNRSLRQQIISELGKSQSKPTDWHRCSRLCHFGCPIPHRLCNDLGRQRRLRFARQNTTSRQNQRHRCQIRSIRSPIPRNPDRVLTIQPSSTISRRGTNREHHKSITGQLRSCCKVSVSGDSHTNYQPLHIQALITEADSKMACWAIHNIGLCAAIEPRMVSHERS